ncbi:MAG: Holliday junction branch migration protein RuvA [Deltaproteobacteria bacterium]|jgi:Holliday junction DNA helicase RuvA|nr:Holliday junction branch migration protein RuvA [Deltaproteobacteria bacterium]
MIAHLKGKLFSIKENRLVLMTGGIGWDLLVSRAVSSLVDQQTEELSVHVYTHTSEHAFNLYGFATSLEKELFEKLISVSGVGPKAAMAVLSTLDETQLVAAILNEDMKMLTKAPGIGKKSAKRLILELSEKLKEISATMPSLQTSSAVEIDKYPLSHELEQTFSALQNLGYKQKDLDAITGRLKKLAKDGVEVEVLIRTGLSLLRKGS